MDSHEYCNEREEKVLAERDEARRVARLLCSLCMYLNVPKGEDAADTVINGQAVCLDHASYVQGGEHSLALAAIVRDRGFASLDALQRATTPDTP